MCNSRIVDFIRELYGSDGFVPLHEPYFAGKEREYLLDCIDSTFVSSVGRYVDRFEEMICDITGAGFAVATVNGTSALHVALLLSGVVAGDEVITQPLTFVATANAISYCGAVPLFLDVNRESLGLCPQKLSDYLATNCELNGAGECVNRGTGRVIRACVPMHTFGHAVELDGVLAVCEQYNIVVVEDAAESLGSVYRGRHTGTFGRFGVFSFNGNKTVTCGGGGVIVCNDQQLARRAKHITTTAKMPHRWEYNHDCIGFNYRMPNLNAALAVAQLEMLDVIVADKRKTAGLYQDFFTGLGVECVEERAGCFSNYWLNAIIFSNYEERNSFLQYSNDSQVMTRPIWQLMNRLDIFADCPCGNLDNSQWLAERVVNIPSSVRL